MAQNAQATAVLSRSRSNQYYRAALETSAQYVSAAALRAKLLDTQQSLPGVPAVSAPENADTEMDEWLAAVVAADTATRARETKINALRERIIWCDRAITDVVVTETDRILALLHDDLMDVMDHVFDVAAKLHGAHNAQQVIDAGVGDVWKQLTPLRVEYDKIRTAQEWSMAGEDLQTWSRSDYLWDDSLASDLMIRNLDELYPEWKSKSKSANTFRISGAPEPDPRPWPSDPVEQLVWLCMSDAEVWVPTLSELNQLNRERSARLNEVQNQLSTTSLGAS